VWRWLIQGKGRKYADAFGLLLDDPDPSRPQQTIYRNEWGEPSVEVHSVRTALRRDSRGAVLTDLVIEITQRRRGYFDPKDQEQADRGPPIDPDMDGDFKFRTGVTIVIDTTKNVFRHVIRTAGTIAEDAELEMVRTYLTGDAGPSVSAFEGVRTKRLRAPNHGSLDEPFALLHRHAEE
jgi:hypothetical protein